MSVRTIRRTMNVSAGASAQTWRMRGALPGGDYDEKVSQKPQAPDPAGVSAGIAGVEGVPELRGVPVGEQWPPNRRHARPRPTQEAAEHEIEFVTSFIDEMNEERAGGLDAYGRGDFAPSAWVGLLKYSSILWSGKNFRARLFPRGKDPYDLITGTRIVALSQIVSHFDGTPLMPRDALIWEMERADADGRYGVESIGRDEQGRPHSHGGAVNASGPAAKGGIAASSGDESFDTLVAEARDMLEQLAPAYEQMHKRVDALRRFGAEPGRPEFDRIREEAEAAYSPLARIALKAELDRETLLHQKEPSEGRRRLIFSIARELSFSLALLAVAESHKDEAVLGSGMSRLRSPDEISEALSDD